MTDFLPDEIFAFNPKADDEREARAIARQDALAELSDVIVEDEPQFSVLGTAFVDDDGVPGHVFVIGGEPDLLREWVFVTSENEFFNIRTGETVSRAAFDLSMAKITPTVKITKDGGDPEHKKFPASRTLVEFLNGAVVSGRMYRPDVGDPVFDYDQKRWVNAYLRSSVPVAERYWRENDAWMIVREHIHNILPDGADTLIKWLAHNVQYPGVKINWAPVIVGVEGDGKTTISKALAAAMGRAHVGNVSSSALFSNFSGWAHGSCVQTMEEIRVTGQNRSAAMDRLKEFITNPYVPVLQKGKDEFNIVNVTNYLAFTNHIDALAITDGDRRWGVWKTRFDDRHHLLRELKRAYWERLHDAIERFPGVLRSWFLSIDLSDFDRAAPPEVTTWKRAMINSSRGATEAEIREAIDLGGFGVGEGILATDALNDLIFRQCGRKIQTNSLSAILERLGWVKVSGMVDGKRRQIKWQGAARTIYYRPDIFADEPDAETARLHLPGRDLNFPNE